MKYRRIALLAICLALAVSSLGSAFAEYSGTLPEQMFLDAKAALYWMSYGEYQTALDTLHFNAVSAEDFAFFAKASLPSLFSGVQLEVAVALNSEPYGWILAIPVCAPDATDVDTFLLHSSDTQTFDSYTAAPWSFVTDLLPSSSDVIWYDRYVPSDSKVVITDGN